MLLLEDPSVAGVEEALRSILRQSGLRRLHHVVAARAGLTLDRSAYPILGRIRDEGRVRLSDLAAGLDVTMPTISRQVKQLEAAGLIRRAADPADGRASLLELTGAGRRTLERYRAAWQELLAETLAPWDEGDRARLASLLGRLAAELGSLRP